jgi:hypothetical protein
LSSPSPFVISPSTEDEQKTPGVLLISGLEESDTGLNGCSFEQLKSMITAKIDMYKNFFISYS